MRIEQHKDKAIDQVHQLGQQPGQMRPPQYADKLTRRRGQCEQIERADRAERLEHERERKPHAVRARADVKPVQRQAPVPRGRKGQVACDRQSAEQQKRQRHTQQAAVVMQRKAAFHLLQHGQHDNHRHRDRRAVRSKADCQRSQRQHGLKYRIPAAHARDKCQMVD